MEILTNYAIPPKFDEKKHFRKNYYEIMAWRTKNSIIGVDEVGRGCLAGPVVVAAVMLPINSRYRGLKDSKILSEQTRLKAFAWIMSKCEISIVYISPDTIQANNIYQATKKGMKRAIIQLLQSSHKEPVGIVSDAMPLDFNSDSAKKLWVQSLYKAESKSSSVAAASIVAKVIRDLLMKAHEDRFPGYMLDQHKGYATLLHQQRLLNRGRSLIHRTQFVETIYKRHNPHYEQKTLC